MVSNVKVDYDQKWVEIVIDEGATRLAQIQNTDLQMIERICAILSGPFPFGNSHQIQIKFLDPLIGRNKIMPLVAARYWQKGFIEKVKFREQYFDNGSADDDKNFVSISDVELSLTLISSFEPLSDECQQELIKEWVTATDDIFQEIAQPLKIFRGSVEASAIRVYWIKTLTNVMLTQDILKTEAKIMVEQFNSNNKYPIGIAERYFNEHDRVSISQMDRIKIAY